MKTFLSSILVTSFLFTTLVNPALAYDIFGSDNHYIKITLNADKTAVAFEYCSLIKKDVCRQLGNKDTQDPRTHYFSIADLRAQHEIESDQIAYAWMADVLVVVGTVATGGALAYATSTTIAGSIYGTAGGAILGGMGGIYASNFIHWLNPAEQKRQAVATSEDALADRDLVVKSEIKLYARAIHTVLKKLNPVGVK